MNMHWYQEALKKRWISYWSFNTVCFAHKRKARCVLFATRTKTVAKGLGLKHLRKLKDGLFYGVMVRTVKA